MTISTKTPFLLFIFYSFFFLGNSQETRNDSINLYLQQIDYLIANKNNYKDDFIDYEALLLKKERVRGSEKVRVLIKLSKSTMFDSLENATKFNDEALQIAQTIWYKEGILNAKYNQAYFLLIKGNFDQSMKLAEKIERIDYYNQFPKIYANVNNLKSDIYTERGEFDLALETGLRLLDRAEKYTNEYLLMKAYASLSHYYLRKENYSKSLDYCLKGLHYNIKFRNFQKFYPKIDEIARMSSKLGNTGLALELYHFIEELETKMFPLGEYIKSSIYMNMAVLYLARKNPKRASNYISKSIAINLKKNYKFRIPRALTVQAEIYLKTKDTAKAISFYEKSFKAAEDINAFDVVKSNSFILSKLYKNRNNTSKAYEYNTLYEAVRDSLFDSEHEQKIIILEARRQIKEVTHKKEILELKNKAQRADLNLIVIILAFIVVFGFFVTFSYIEVKRKNKILYYKTIELAVIQSESRKRPAHIENPENVSFIEIDVEETEKTTNLIDDDIKNIILSKLEKLEKDHFFISSSCSLHQVAEQLKTNPKYLSQVINQEKKSNFNNYINGLRIDFLINKLLEDKDFRDNKISYIAAFIGYNNANTFNTAFKKKEGILPSYFISQLIQESKVNA